MVSVASVETVQSSSKAHPIISMLFMSHWFKGASPPRKRHVSVTSWGMWILDKEEDKMLTAAAAAAAKSLQLCPTLCDPIDGSPPGSSVPGILQARTLEWVAISFSGVWKWKVKVKSLSCAWILATPRTAAYQAPPSVGFSRQANSGGLPAKGIVAKKDDPEWPAPLVCVRTNWIKITAYFGKPFLLSFEMFSV